MQNRFPSMAGLRAFEAAARHLSFTQASIELNLTQSAVSHQIKKLEELLEAQLFERRGNDIALTEVGQDYLTSARAAITQLQVATDRTIGRQKKDVLTVACLGTFAIKCLFPNLPGFIRDNPDINLRVRTLVPFDPAPSADYDISIQYGMDSDWPGLKARRISNEYLFPVCSPRLCQGENALRIPSDLCNHTLIRTTSPLILRDDWPIWLRRAGIGDLRFASEINCDLLYPSYQAAAEGLGVAMGRSAVVRADIASGRLVEPFDIRLRSHLGYHLVYPEQHARLSKVTRFVDWATGKLGGLFILPEDNTTPDIHPLPQPSPPTAHSP